MRIATGRRRYGAEDVRRAILLRELTNKSFRISEIATFTLKKLTKLLGSAAAADLPLKGYFVKARRSKLASRAGIFG